MDIFLVRHCQSVGNSRRTIQGWYDSPLTGKGRVQAHRLGERLADSGIERLYSSPLSRALETARIVSEAIRTEVVVLELLKEINVGEAEGRTIEEVERLFPRQVSELLGKRNGRASFPGGETIEEFHRRSEKLWHFLTENRQAEVIAAVSHGWMINALLKHATGQPLRSRNRVFANGAIQHLRFTDGEWKVMNMEYIERETAPMRVWHLF